MNTTTKGLTTFEESQPSLTFLEYRQAMAGDIDTSDGSEPSNIQKIDILFQQYDQKFTEFQNEFESQIEFINNSIQEDLKSVISNDEETGTLNIGSESGVPINFYDGSQTSTLEGGKFTTKQLAASSLIVGKYIAEYNTNTKHLVISYDDGIDA